MIASFNDNRFQLLILWMLLIIVMKLHKITFKSILNKLKFVLICGGGVLLIPLPFIKGIDFASIVTMKFFVSVSSCILMNGLATPRQIIHALELIKVPKLFLYIIEFNIRYVALLRDELNRMLVARDSRQYKKKNKMNIKDIKITANLVAILFMRAYKRSIRIHHAMKSRGYKLNL